MGKKKFIIINTLVCCIISFAFGAVGYWFVCYYCKMPFFPTVSGCVLMMAYIIALIVYNIKKAGSVWEENMIRAKGIDNYVTEIKDDELKSLIVKGEKIKAVKRYRDITGEKLSKSKRYVDLMTVYYDETNINKKEMICP